MAKPTLSGRIPQDTHERFEQYAEEHNLSKSDAMRRLLTKGMDHEDGELDTSEQEEKVKDALIGSFFLSAGVIFGILSYVAVVAQLGVDTALFLYLLTTGSILFGTYLVAEPLAEYYLEGYNLRTSVGKTYGSVRYALQARGSR